MGALSILAPFAGPLIILALIGGLYGTHKVSVWNAHRVGVNEATATCDAEKEVIRKRATDLALLWSAQAEKTEAAQRAAESRQLETFGTLAERAAAVRRGGGIPIPFDVVGVRRSASVAANASRPAQVGPRAAAAIPRPAETTERTLEPQVFDESDIAGDEVKKAAAYASAYGKWQGCVNFYTNVKKDADNIGERGAANTTPP